MNIFKTPQEFAEYLPNCLICGKELNFSINGTITPLNVVQSRYAHGNEHIKLRMNLKDGLLQATHKRHNVYVELATGKVVEGQDLFDRFYMDSVIVMKTCGTCDFKLETWTAQNLGKGQFPIVSLRNERLHYTLKGGKDVEIVKRYHPNVRPEIQKNTSVSIKIANKYIPEILFDFEFSKFKNLAHLNQRLGTILLFQ